MHGSGAGGAGGSASLRSWLEPLCCSGGDGGGPPSGAAGGEPKRGARGARRLPLPPLPLACRVSQLSWSPRGDGERRVSAAAEVQGVVGPQGPSGAQSGAGGEAALWNVQTDMRRWQPFVNVALQLALQSVSGGGNYVRR